MKGRNSMLQFTTARKLFMSFVAGLAMLHVPFALAEGVSATVDNP